MKVLGKVKCFFGIEVARGESGIFLSQRKYALDIIDEMGMMGCKPISTLLELNHRLLADDGLKCEDPSRFRRVVGHLVLFGGHETGLELCCACLISGNV